MISYCYLNSQDEFSISHPEPFQLSNISSLKTYVYNENIAIVTTRIRDTNYVYLTENKGLSWELILKETRRTIIPYHGGIQQLTFAGSENFLLTYDRGIVNYTTDKGENWIESVPDSSYLNSGAYLPYHFGDTTYLFHYKRLITLNNDFENLVFGPNPFESKHSLEIDKMALTKDGCFKAIMWDTLTKDSHFRSKSIGSDEIVGFDLPTHMNKIHFINKNVGWCYRQTPVFHKRPDSTNFQIIYKTIDGGKNWKKQLDTTIYWLDEYSPDLIYASEIIEMNFYDENFGFANCSYGTHFYTEDGGENWKLLFDIEYAKDVLNYIHKIIPFDKNTALIRVSSKVFLLQRNPSGVFEIIPEFGSKNQSYLAKRGGEIHLQNLEILNSPALHTIMGAEVENNLQFVIGKNASVITLPFEISCGLYFIHLDTPEGRQFIQVLIQD